MGCCVLFSAAAYSRLGHDTPNSTDYKPKLAKPKTELEDEEVLSKACWHVSLSLTTTIASAIEKPFPGCLEGSVPLDRLVLSPTHSTLANQPVL